MYRRVTAIIAILVGLAVVMVLAFGCSVPSQAPVESAPQAEAPAPIEQMSLAEKSMIASSFPVPIPVPSGRVVDGNAQGDGAWDYTLAMTQPPRDVAEWYERKMAQASWTLLDITERQDGGYNLAFAKGRAESGVQIAPDGEGSKVVVAIGVGAPVLQTQ